MIKFILVLNNDGNLVYGMTPPEVEAHIEKKTAGQLTIFAPVTHSKALYGLEEAETTIRAYANKKALIWVLGNAELFKRTIDVADQLYISQLDMFDNAEEEFIRFSDNFEEIGKSKIFTSEDGVRYQHQIWKRKK
jgi:hypothetical protein